MAQVEAKVQPDCVGNDIGRETVSFINIHRSSLAFPMSLLVNTLIGIHASILAFSVSLPDDGVLPPIFGKKFGLRMSQAKILARQRLPSECMLGFS